MNARPASAVIATLLEKLMPRLDSNPPPLIWWEASQARPFWTAALVSGVISSPRTWLAWPTRFLGRWGWGWAGGGAAWRARRCANAGVAASAKITGARR